MRLRLWSVLCLCILSGCGAAPAETPPPPAEIVTHRDSNKPPLLVVEREGDPVAAVALAAFSAAGVETNRSLAHAALNALARQGFDAHARFSSYALVLGAYAKQGGKTTCTQALRQALLAAPVPLVAVAGGPVAFEACTAQAPRLSVAAARAQLGYLNTRYAAVGDAAFMGQVRQHYSAGEEWPSGVVPAEPWPQQDAYRSEHAPGDVDVLTLALRTPASVKALSAARELAQPDSTLRLLAAALNPAWEVAQVSAELRAEGACLSAELHTAAPSSVEAAAHALRALQPELQFSVRQAEASPQLLLGTEEGDPRQAAMRAAWSSLSDATAEQPQRWLARHATSHTDAVSLAQKVNTLQPPKLQLSHALEQGQGRVWALLTSACPTEHESVASAGHTFAALAAAARLQSTADVQLQPWVAGDVLGLVASVSASAPAPQLRLSRALGRALLGALHQPALLADVRKSLQAERASVPGWELALGLVSDGHPSELTAVGLPSALASLSSTRADAALRGFAAKPLQLAVLGNLNAEQAQQLQQDLTQLLWPFKPGSVACTPRTTLPQQAGEFVLSDATPAELPPAAGAAPSVPSTAPAQVWLAYPTRAEQWQHVYWLAAALNGPQGWLEKAVRKAGWISHGQAYALGRGQRPGALIIELSTTQAATHNAVAQTRALLERLAQRTLDPSTWTSSGAVHANLASRLDPRVRLTALLYPAAEPPDPAAIARFMRAELQPAQLIVVRTGPNPGGP